MSAPFAIKLSFDPLLKPRLFGSQRSSACENCRTWFNPKIYFMVNPHGLATVEDVVNRVRIEHGIETDVFFQSGGFHIPLGLKSEALKQIQEQIDVIPWGPTAPRVTFPTCNCAAVAGAAQVGQMTPGLSRTGSGDTSRTGITESPDGTDQFNENTSVWSYHSELDQSPGPYTGNIVAWGNFPRM